MSLCSKVQEAAVTVTCKILIVISLKKLLFRSDHKHLQVIFFVLFHISSIPIIEVLESSISIMYAYHCKSMCAKSALEYKIQLNTILCYSQKLNQNTIQLICDQFRSIV